MFQTRLGERAMAKFLDSTTLRGIRRAFGRTACQITHHMSQDASHISQDIEPFRHHKSQVQYHKSFHWCSPTFIELALILYDFQRFLMVFKTFHRITVLAVVDFQLF